MHEKISSWLNENNIAILSEMQIKARKEILKGKNALIIAPTGHGKTLAAMIPIFESIMQNNSGGLQALYIAPTKSLNRDIFKKMEDLANQLGLSAKIRHGDTTSTERKKQSINPPTLLITTPESLQSMFISENMKSALKSVKFAIIDEIHELMPTKRGAQLSLGLERLNRLADFKRIGLSATIPNEKYAKEFLCGKRPCEIISFKEKKSISINAIKPNESRDNSDLAKKIGAPIMLVNAIFKINELLDTCENAIIFANSRQQAEMLAYTAFKIFPELKIMLHHSSLSKSQRIMSEESLKEKKIKALISTSSMELGIDVGSIDLIIQFSSPKQSAKLIQRAGRSGHSRGKQSRCEIITLNEEDYFESIAISKLAKKGFSEKSIIQKNPLDVLAHQIIGFLRDDEKITFEKLHSCINKSKCFKIPKQGLMDFLNFLKSLNYIDFDGEKMAPRPKSFFYYFQSISTIPDLKKYKVSSFDTRARIGTLDESFASQYCFEGSEIIMKGEAWKVLEKSESEIIVAKATPSNASVPSWQGEMIPVSMKAAKAAFYEKSRQKKSSLPKNAIFIERAKSAAIFNCAFGTKINETLRMMLESLICQRSRKSIIAKSDPYRIIIFLPQNFSFAMLKDLIDSISSEMIKEIIRLTLKNSPIFKMRLFNVAQRFGMLKKGCDYNERLMNWMAKKYEGTYLSEETINEIMREKLSIKGAKKAWKTKKIYSKSEELSIDSKEALSKEGFHGILLSGESEEKKIESVKKRLNEKKFEFACLNCKEEFGQFTCQSFPFKKCPKCQAKTISFFQIGKERKKKDWEETADLFMGYGNLSCFVFAGFGVGAKAAKRILFFDKPEDELIKDILEEEKKFIRTRQYWN